MKTKKLSWIFFVMLLPIFGCKKHPVYSFDQLLQKAKEHDQSVDLVPIDKDAKVKLPPPCEGYGEGCKNSYRVKIKGLEVIWVEYKTDAQAELEAKRFEQFWVRNWLLDDVAGEPEIESFIVQKMGAQKNGAAKSRADH